MEMKTILWPTDLSEYSLTAAPAVAHFAGLLGARVVLLYVGIDLDNYFPAYGKPSTETHDEFQKWELEEAKKRLGGLCKDKLCDCRDIEAKVTTGDPAEKILDAIDIEGADLVIMASHGRGRKGKKPALFGGVTEKVVKNSPVKVLTVNAFGR